MFTQEQMLKLWEGLTTDEMRARRLAEAQSWLSKREHHDRLVADARKRHERELHSHQVDLNKLQDVCPHWLERYVPDASGNNDSYHVCELCGRER